MESMQMGKIFAHYTAMFTLQKKYATPQKWITTAMHVGVWCVFLGTPLLFSPAESPAPFGITPPAENVRQWVAFAINSLLVIFFYLNFALLIPKFYLKENRSSYFIYVLSYYLFYQLSIHLVREHVFSNITTQSQLDFITQTSIMVTSLFFLVMWGASSGLRIAQEWNKTESERKENERKRLEAELALLKSQINPHFLLNTLNNLYTISITESEKTPDALYKLSEMVKYILHDCTQATTTLEKEVTFIQNYLELQRLRLSENIQLVVELPEEQDLNMHIEPMLLITFIENAFKHGLTARKQIQIQISLKYDDGVLDLYVVNPIIHHQNVAKESVSGLGILNTQQRLESMYGKNHTLMMIKTDDAFQVELKIKLT